MQRKLKKGKELICKLFQIWIIINSTSYYRRVSVEEGEVADDVEDYHPMNTITKIDPEEIPEVSNKFLMRGERPESDKKVSSKHDEDRGSKGFVFLNKSPPI